MEQSTGSDHRDSQAIDTVWRREVEPEYESNSEVVFLGSARDQQRAGGRLHHLTQLIYADTRSTEGQL